MEDDEKKVSPYIEPTAEYVAWMSRKGTVAPEVAAPEEAAPAPTVAAPAHHDIIERNKKINNAAAADAVHDFKGVRGENSFALKTRTLIESLFGKTPLTGNAILQSMQTLLTQDTVKK
jgi:hypothetical protein